SAGSQRRGALCPFLRGVTNRAPGAPSRRDGRAVAEAIEETGAGADRRGGRDRGGIAGFRDRPLHVILMERQTSARSLEPRLKDVALKRKIKRTITIRKRMKSRIKSKNRTAAVSCSYSCSCSSS